MTLGKTHFRLLISLALVWLLAAGFAAYEIERSRREYLREAETTTVFQAQAFGENTRSTIKRLNELLLHLRTEWHGDWERFAAVVKARQTHIQDITFQIGVIDAEGLLAYSNLAPPKDRTDLSDREHFRVHRDSSEDRLFISKPIKGRVTGRWTIQFTRPILVDGAFKGVIVASISPDNFIAFHDTLKLGELGASSILRDDSEVMAYAPNGDEYLGRVTSWPLQVAASPVSGTFFASKPDGIERVFGYRKLPEYGLTCLVAEATQDLLAPHQQHARNVLGYALGIAALLSIFILMLQRTAVAREQALAKLRESEEQLRLLGTGMAQTTASLVVTDTTGAIVFVNDAFVRNSGYAREEVLGQNPRLLKSGLNPPELYQNLWVTITSGRTWRGELQNRKKDGTLYWELAIISPVTDENGAISHFIAVKEDITEHKRTEDELVQYRLHLEELVEKRTADLGEAKMVAEAANRAKSVFLANMSHELRTPLNAILGFSSLARTQPGLGEGPREMLDIINRSGEHLLALINDVLEIAKIESGKLQLDVAPLDLGHLVRDVTEMMRMRAAQKGLSLELDQSSEFPRYIKGDEARLRQILVNLVGNAIKFTEQGEVVIRLGVKDSDRSHLLIEVEDTGPGIRPEDRQRLFQPFQQLAEGTKQGGTGLGLAITHQFVQLMGGCIGVDSEPGRGSRFRVNLPLELASEEEVRRMGEASRGEVVGLVPGQPAWRVLIVEDQRENRMLLERLMADLGLQTKTAENGEACVRLFEDWQPDLIWMDRRMPVMDGVEASRRIRALPGGDKVKIVAVTASVFKEQQPELEQAGMDDLVRKPYRTGEIYDCMARQLGAKLVYRDAAATPRRSSVALTPERLGALPQTLRTQLQGALEVLDTERIEELVRQVAAIDAALAGTLSALVERFDYAAILAAIEQGDGN
ncbi:MAG: PAS domain S-box protein [Rhodocyclaceae bacterium]|nr:PAS domain S-box protein [Rhodocyclaceae bacterium]